ncbi:MAG TPA: hypothetical protein VLZ83_06650 [Edaphocola sp.]|nr:hypothetical protein [Edaphocola sp.]
MITVMTATPGTMSGLLEGFSDFVTAAISSITTVVGAITSEPLLLLGVFAGLLGIGIGIIRRFV